jgi:hypothetical protein
MSETLSSRFSPVKRDSVKDDDEDNDFNIALFNFEDNGEPVFVTCVNACVVGSRPRSVVLLVYSWELVKGGGGGKGEVRIKK